MDKDPRTKPTSKHHEEHPDYAAMGIFAGYGECDVSYDIWQARCDVPSEWDGGGRCVETVHTREEADRAIKEYQRGGHAAWFVRNDP